MKTLLVSGLVAAGLLGTGVGGTALVAASDEGAPDERPPSHVQLPEQAQVPEDLPEQEEPEAPEDETEAPEEETEAPEDETEDQMGEPASEEGRERRAAALAHVAAMQAWTACIAEAAPAHDNASGPFDPEAACGTKPTPPAANEADDTGRPSETPPSDAGAEGRATAEEAQGRGGRPEGGEEDDAEGPEDTGRPEGAGPPEGVGKPGGAGKPEGAGQG